mmetsp:Transcript_17449/g.29364  ORF Transcript_17449/g.29364 Transcript_17449/m.29364 type:complete len:110 (+) Transcript_17449:513-842(+)
MLSTAQIVFINLLNVINNFSGFFQGYFMVRATKMVVRQISSQEVNSRAVVERVSEMVRENERKIYLMIIVQVVLQALGGYFYFFCMDQSMEKEYKQEYLEFKQEHYLNT